MASHDRPLRIAIFGARGIGRVHARIFHALSAEICAVFGSSDESAARAARDLSDSFGIRAKAYSRIEHILAEPLDAVSICTPPQLHMQHIAAAFDKRLPVFCEKPLFWDNDSTLATVERNLRTLQRHPARQLFVNTSNTVLLDAVRDRLPPSEEVSRFFFQFHTHGPFQGPDIAVDLLPHGLSLLLHCFGKRELSAFSWEVTPTNCHCTFMYGRCAVEFDFQEIPTGPVALRFSLNDHQFQRIGEGSGASYQVYLADGKTGEKLRVPDPFTVYISRFLQHCRDEALEKNDDFAAAAANLLLMAQCVDAGNSTAFRHPENYESHEG